MENNWSCFDSAGDATVNPMNEDCRFAHQADVQLEAAEHQLGSRPIAGVDEAGRGPWAGPVVAAAVILNPDRIPANIDDSKVLDEDFREPISTSAS